MAGQKYHRRKEDPLFWSGITAEELACDKAAAPFDEAIRQMDAKWGIGRLVANVSPETAAKWGSALAKLNAAIAARDVDETVARVGVLLRGLTAMDAEAEAEVFEHFRQLARERIAVLISHRFSTVRMADQIAVLDQGRLVELGSHEALMQAGGQYARLFALQARGYR